MNIQKALYFLETKSILFDARTMVVELKQLAKRYIAENKKLEIICLAEATGHKDLAPLL